jgi:hypothetical protein
MNKKQKKGQEDNICLICYEESKIRKFCSDCNICEDCFSDYLIHIYKNSLKEINQVVKCANHNCRNQFDFVEIIHKLKEDIKQTILKLLLDNYITNINDIVRCPTSNCNYAATLIDEDRCCEQFQCELCGEKWKNNKKLNTYYDKEHIKAEFSELIVHLTSVPCTHCSIRIIKTQGCDHIKCVRCQKEFCYNCMKDYSTHLKETMECSYKRDTKATYIFAFVILGSLKFLFGFSTTRYILHLIFYRFLINFVLMNVICCMYTYIIFLLIANCMSPNRHNYALSIFGSCVQTKICTGLLVIIGIIHLYLYHFNEDVQYYTIFFIKEIMIIFILCIGFAVLHFLYSNVRSRIR